MPLSLFKVMPPSRGLVMLTTRIIEKLNLASQMPILAEFQKELNIEFVKRVIFGKAIKLNQTVILQGLVRKKLKKEPTKRSALLEDETLVSDNMDDEFLEKYNYYRENRLIVPESVYSNNRVQFIDEIRRKMLGLKFKKDDATCDSKSSKDFTPLVHQMIVTRYLNSYTPYRGLLLYHGLGSGKTCSSITIMEGMKSTHQIYIMTPASLQANYRTQMKYCGDQLFKTNNHWVFEEFDERSGALLKAFYELTGIHIDYLKKQPEIDRFIKDNGGVWMIIPDKEPNFDDLDEGEQSIIEQQIDLMIKSKYKYINYNGINSEKWRSQYTLGGTINPFDNSIIIIDEVHNFVSRINNKIKQNKTSVSTDMYEAILDAENCKIIPLSGTPYINYPCELGVLFNLIGGYTYALEVTFTIHNSKINETYFKKLLDMPYIDILQYDQARSKLTIVQNPYGFKKQESGKMIYDEEFMSRTEFHDAIIEQLSNKEDYKIKIVEMTKYKKLPDNEKEFNSYFVTADFKINNKEWFQSKILGMVSYLGDKSELMPEIVKTADDTDIHMVKVNMSPHQIKTYSAIRNEERKMERQKKGNKKGVTDEFNSTYRVFSRSCCNFAFPTELPRPMPTSRASTKASTEEEIDALNNKELLEDVDGKFDELDVEDRKEDSSYQTKITRILEEFSRNSDQYFNSEIPKLVPVINETDKTTLEMYSPKMKAVLNNLITEENIGCNLLYSNFRRLEGIGIFSIILKYYGFIQLKIEPSAGGYRVVLDRKYDDAEYIGPKKVFALYTGTENNEQKEIIRNIYNSNYDALPNNIVAELNEYFPEVADKNLYGGIIKLLMITSSGAEGIDLKNTRYVHIMEPYWHHVRINQVIGRARRICSHSNLDEEYRDVKIYLYISNFSPDIDLEEFNSLKTQDDSKSTDEALYDIMERKRGLSKMFLDTLKEASVDCIVNYKDKCVQYPFTKRADKLIAGIDYKKDPLQKLKGVTDKKEIVKQTILTNGKLVAYAVDTTSIPNKLYDYAMYKSNPSEPVQVGYVENHKAMLY